jgi:hypothetical protein
MRRFRPQQWPSALWWIVTQLLRATPRAHGEGRVKSLGLAVYRPVSAPRVYVRELR